MRNKRKAKTRKEKHVKKNIYAGTLKTPVLLENSSQAYLIRKQVT